MKAFPSLLNRICAFLTENRFPLTGFLLLWSFGLTLGTVTFSRLFLGVFEEKLAGLTSGLSADPPAVLFFGLLPPLLYGAAMLLTARTRLALPLWGGAVLLNGSSFGYGAAFALLLIRAEKGASFLKGTLVLLPLLPLAVGGAILALLPFPRLRREADPFGHSFACEDVLAFLPWITGYAALRLLTVSLPALLLSRGLWR